MANLFRSLIILYPTHDADPGMFEMLVEKLLNEGLGALAGKAEIEVIFPARRIRHRTPDGTVIDYLVDVRDGEEFPDFPTLGELCWQGSPEERYPGADVAPSIGSGVSVMCESKWRPLYNWTKAIIRRYYHQGLRMRVVAYDVGNMSYYSVIPTVVFYTVDSNYDGPFSHGENLAALRTDGVEEDVPLLDEGTDSPLVQEPGTEGESEADDMFQRLLDGDTDKPPSVLVEREDKDH